MKGNSKTILKIAIFIAIFVLMIRFNIMLCERDKAQMDLYENFVEYQHEHNGNTSAEDWAKFLENL